MVIKTIQDDILNSDIKHIAFAVNREGINDSGFARQISARYWNELSSLGEQEIGTVLSKQIGDKTFHALVCHSLEDGWGDNQKEVIKDCFDKIPANGEKIGTIAIGTGFVGQMSGAKFRQIVCGMHESSQEVVLYAGYTLNAVIKCYNEEKELEKRTNERRLVLNMDKKRK